MMAHKLTQYTPCCPRCGKGLFRDSSMRICLKCGYKCDVITGKPLDEYKTKDGKEIDRLRAENKALISERAEVMEILAEAMGHESIGDHAPLTMADAAAKVLVSLRKRVGELEAENSRLVGENAELLKKWIGVKDIAVGLCNSVTRFRSDTDDVYQRLSEALTAAGEEGERR